MNCPKCLIQLNSETTFCPFCGKKIKKEEYEIATKMRRLINFLLDLIFVYIFASLIGVLMYFLPEETADYLLNTNDTAFGILIFVVYYTIFESLFSKTPAKFITGTKVVTYEKEDVTFLQCLARSFARVLPFNQISIFLSKENQCWHDRFANTVVVKDRV